MKRFAVVCALATLIACAPASVTRVVGVPEGPPFEAALAVRGSHEVEVAAGSFTSAAGCVVGYERFTPSGVAREELVVVAHGFLRNLTSMRGWGEHLASHGLAAVVVSLCRSTPFAGRHDGNAIDLRAIADLLGAEERVYVGFSAGGLAAMLAAAADERAVGMIGLDAVDSGGLAAGAGTGLPPALFLAGEAGSCNANGNMLAVTVRIPNAVVLPIPAATHCDFERPTDGACARLCGRVEPPEAAAVVRARIVALATAFALERLPRRGREGG